ncbi:MAG: metalloregulator ArsR/SmtB family transcription factor [Steroidobacteraceae bacterium]|jgi:ArsR family transcriptional regulator|nr:metalloregulator ArsR/SmtB family transcription factor [Steroidobacteraceae bacterium]
MSSFLATVSALRAAGEPTRLRLLVLLARAELTVGELCEIVGQSQPRVSRHLKVLTDAGLSDRFREQHWVYYRAPTDPAARQVVEQLLKLVEEDDDVLRRDLRRMAQVIDERARRATGDAPHVQTAVADLEVLDATVLGELENEPIGALLDVGTGAGHLLGLLGPQATRAVGVDISSDALRVARTNLHGAGLSHCELQRGDMYDLPFAAPMFDTTTVDRVLAGAERPAAALREIARTLRPGGRLVIIEDFDALSELSDNPIATVKKWIAAAGFECTRVRPLDAGAAHLLITLARRAERTTAAA